MKQVETTLVLVAAAENIKTVTYQFYPQVEIKAFEFRNIIEYRLPPSIIVGDAKIFAHDPTPWDNELAQILEPLYKIKWNQKDEWQKFVKGRIDKY